MNKLTRYSIAIGLILIVILNVFVQKDFWDASYDLFWFCNNAAIILAIGFMIGSKTIVSGISLLAIPAQFLWIIDFILEIIGFGSGRTSSVFSDPLIEIVLTVILHLVLIPISLYGVYSFGFSKKGFILVFLYVLTILPITFAFTDAIDNINCVYYPCDMNGATMLDTKYFWTKYMPSWLIIYTIECFLVYMFLIWKNNDIQKKSFS